MMEKTLQALAQNMAHNLIEIRQKRNLTQQGLGKLVGLPRSTIANLESGEGNPSLVNLAKISFALNTSIEELLGPAKAICKLIPATEIPSRVQAEGKIKVLNLLPESIPHTKIDRIELKPGALLKGVPHQMGTKECFYCLEGEITIHVLAQKFLLNKGDVLAFPGEVGHSYSNSGKSNASGFSVVVLSPIPI